MSPAPGQVMDNGRTDRNDNIVWEFSWGSCPGATSYQLYAIGATASIPVIDQVVNNTFYRQVSNGSYIADHKRLGWSWRVRVMVGGQWSDWSAPRFFDVEPVNSDTG